MENLDIEALVQAGTTFGLRAIGAIVFLLCAKVVASMAKRATVKAAERGGLDATLSRFLSGVAGSAVMLMAVLGCLGLFGIETTSFAAVLGAAGVAIGLAFQGTLSSLAAGVLLLVFRPFKIGDVISVAGVTGKVFDIQLFVTSLDTPDNRRLILANSQAFGSVIENVSHHATRRVDVSVGCDYGADASTTRAALLKATSRVEGVLLDPAPAAVLTGLGASSVDWTVRAWCASADYFVVKELLTEEVKRGLDAEKIGIPYSTVDVNIVTQAAPQLPAN